MLASSYSCWWLRHQATTSGTSSPDPLNLEPKTFADTLSINNVSNY